MTMTVKGRVARTPEPEEHLAETPAPRSLRWLLVAIVAALAPAVGLGVWWYSTAGPGAYTTVPEVLSLGAADAEAALAGAGLDVVTVEEFHATLPAGTVIDVSAAGGERILKDGVVTVTVSKGQDLREIWVEGAGTPLENAENALLAAGFELLPVEHVYSDTVPAGTVVAMTTTDGEPVALGDTFPVGTQIVLTCSDGKEPVTVPNVVGMTGQAAVTALQAAGLQVTSSKAYSDVAAGLVVSQNPAAGTDGFRLDTVAIVISKGPAPVVEDVLIPGSIIGMGKFAALDLLAAKGFDARYERGTCTVDWSDCVVRKTVPAAGTRQPKGSTVTIWLTNPSGTSTMGTVPSLVGLPKYTAWDKISAAGFKGVHIDEGCTNLPTLGYEGCVVAEQSPAAGTSLAKGSKITIWLTNA